MTIRLKDSLILRRTDAVGRYRVAMAVVFILGPAVTACGSATPEAPPTPAAEQSEQSEVDVLIGPQSTVPDIGVQRLASLPVFPTTDKPLLVNGTEPGDGSEEVSVRARDARIVVRFNHPVVPLVSDGEGEANVVNPLFIEPPIDGEGQWIDTSTFVLTPSADLQTATLYNVSIRPGLIDQMGASLDEDHHFTFTTESSRVVAVGPARGENFVGPSRTITVALNTVVDPISARDAFDIRLTDAEAPLAGRFEVEGNLLTFTPDEAMERGARYQGRIAAGVKTVDGRAVTESDYLWSFATVPDVNVSRTSPIDGADNIRRGDGVAITFSTPMKTSALTVTLRPTITNQAVHWDDDSRVANVSGGFEPSQEYLVTVQKAVGRFDGILEEPFTFGFTTAQLAPRTTLYTGGRFGVYSAAHPQVVWMTAINREQQELSLTEMSTDDLVGTAVDYGRFDRYRPSNAPSEAVERTWIVDTSSDLNIPNTVSTTLAADGGSLRPGAYHLVSAQSDRRVFVVSDVNVTLKSAPDELLVWVTDLESGRDVENALISVFDTVSYEDRSAIQISEGSSDADGLWRAPIERAGETWGPIVVVVKRDGRFAGAAATDWADGIEPWSFDVPYDAYRSRWAAGVYTDRPVYRAGQSVNFRGVARLDDDAAYELPLGATVNVTLRDPNYETVMETSYSLDDFGTFDGNFPLSASAPLGGYRIEVLLYEGGELEQDLDQPDYVFSHEFRVAAYRKPDFEVSVTTEHPAYVDGDTIKATIQAEYAFGGPVGQADVTWRLLRDDFFFESPLPGYWRFTDYDLLEDRFNSPEAAVMAEGTGTTDDDGLLVVEVPADLIDVPISQVFTLDAEVSDINNQVVAQRASAVVHKANAYVGVLPDKYVTRAGDAAAVEVAVVTPDGLSVPEREVTLGLHERTWYSIRERREDGRFYWTSHFTDTLVAERTVTTDAEGLARATLAPESPGVHRVTATTTDGEQRTAVSAAYLWVTARRGFVNWRQENNDRIDLVADQREYAPGDTAEILIPAPFEGAEALVTVERGRIREVRRIRLEGNDETIQVPITADLAPNVYVGVVLIKGVDSDHASPQIKVGYTNLLVRLDAQRLELQITPDREPAEYQPRDTVRWDVDITDQAGEPVQAEVSLALVDRTLLALVEDTSRSLENVFWSQRPLGVKTSASLTRSIDRLNEQLESDRKGGGGGMAAPGGTVRRLFQDTAYWNPGLRTDEDGHAEFETQLPDNLTTWRLDARAITGADTRVGQAKAEVVARLPILLRPVLPRFAVIGDQAQIEAVIQNGTEEDAVLEVTLDALGLEVFDDHTRSLEVPAGGKGKVIWNTRVDGQSLSASAVPGAAGDITLGMRLARAGAQSGGQVGEALDAVELRVPAYRFTQPITIATAGEVEDRISERFELPAEAAESSAALSVSLNPSLAGESLAQVEALRVFPYLCSEQTVSRFLPNIAAFEAAAEMGQDAEDQREALETEVLAGIQRLTSLQNSDGGWGWWSGGESRAWLSAYALLGLSRADRAGFAVPEHTLAEAVSYLKSTLDSRRDPDGALDVGADDDADDSTDDTIVPSHGSDRRAFVTWVLSDHGEDVGSRAVRLWENRDALSVSGRAFLAMALDAAGPEQSGRVDGLLAALASQARLGPDGAHFEPERRDPIAMESATRATAIAVFTLSQLRPDAPNLDDAVRWLLVASATGGRGATLTTQEQAWTVLALSESLRAGGDRAAGAEYQVQLNGVPMETGSLEDVADSADVAVMSGGDGLRAGEANDLSILKSGEGQLFYTARLQYAVGAAGVLPEANGIAVARRYLRVDPARFTPYGEPVDEAQIGDVLQVELTVVTDQTLNYVMLEDPLPAGFEAIDTDLRTTSAAASGPEMVEVRDEEDEAHGYGSHGWGWWDWEPPVWARTEIRDEKVAVFAEQLHPGTYRFTYLIRASLAGDFLVMPAHAEEMYFPTTSGHSSGGVFRVGRPEGEGR